MEKTEINNGSMSLTIPEGFSPAMQDKKDNWIVKNEELHVMYNITWKKIPLFPKVSLDKAISNTARQIGKQIPSFAMNQDNISHTIGGQQALGFRYSYTTDGINMTSEYLLTEHNKFYYAFICLGRTESFDDHYEIFEKMLSSVELK